MTHPHYENVTTDTALQIARSLKFGPLPRPEDPTPPIDEAITLIHEARGRIGFNWITGRVSEEVLRLDRGY